MLAALPLGVVFALQDFEQAVQMGGEARDPQRHMPRAVIGTVIIGTLLYLALEVAFIGVLNPADLLHGWDNPVGKGDYGRTRRWPPDWDWVGLPPCCTWMPSSHPLAPALSTSARLSYALGHAGYAPKGVSPAQQPGRALHVDLPVVHRGLICFLPFPSWPSLVGLVTSATVIMHGFAPITLLAQRRTVWSSAGWLS